jgi:hypothetical protein
MSEELWVALSHPLLDSKAWRKMSTGARCLYVELKRYYRKDLKNNGRIFLSQRNAEKRLGRDTNQITRWFSELEHFGFIVQTEPPRLGFNGAGRAPRWRLTEVGYMKEAPTRDFQKWDGTPFREGINIPAHKRKKGQTTDCPICGVEFKRARKDAKYCSHTCRQNAYRARDGKRFPVRENTDAYVRENTDTTVREITDTVTDKRPRNNRHTRRISVREITDKSSMPSTGRAERPVEPAKQPARPPPAPAVQPTQRLPWSTPTLTESSSSWSPDPGRGKLQ